MADINLNFEGSTLYGQKFPNVFIESIDVQVSEGDDREGTDDINMSSKFVIKLNLKFTKPKDLQSGDVRYFINNELKGLRLYSYIVADIDYCNQLESNSLSVKEFKEHMEDLVDRGIGGTRQIRHNLTDIIAPEGDIAASINVSDVFDSEGNEAIEISDIELEFEHIPLIDGVGEFYENAPISDIQKYFFVAFVGLKDGASYISSDMKEVLYNTYFGNITYYHMLEFNELASRFYRAYAFEDGAPYYGNVLQHINGKFYSTENYTFEDIKTSFLSLIDEYQDKRAGDIKLNKDISDLEAIIMAEQNKTNILGEITTYQSVYPNKDQATLSGQFYNAFVTTFSDVLATLGAQQQVFQKLYLDSLITDSRNTLLSGVYTKPTITLSRDTDTLGAILVRGVDEDGEFGDTNTCQFIDDEKFICSRRSLAVERLYDSVGADSYFESGAFPSDIAYGSGHYLEMMIDGLKRYEGRSDLGMTPGTDGYGYGEYSSLWLSLYEKYLLGLDEEGREPDDDDYTGSGALPVEMASELATTETNYILSELGFGSIRDLYDRGSGDDIAGSTESSVRFEDHGSETITTLGDVAKTLNFIIKINGVFFFDYEAALRTQTAISKVLSITKLQQYFRMNIPYTQFYFEEASIMRKEQVTFTDTAFRGVECTIYCDFTQRKGDDEGKYKVYTSSPGTASPTAVFESDPKLPIPTSTGISWDVGSGFTLDHIDMTYHRYKYLRPYAKSIDGSTYIPFLKFKNFDLPFNGNKSNQLKYYNTLDNYPDSYPDTPKTLDGYRLACFQFQDLCDDDVAYYNTNGAYLVDDAVRANNIGRFSIEGTENTVYKIKIKMIDRTKQTLTNLYKYVLDIYNDYEEYVSEARDICSFNNITNTYNDHFVQALNEKYIVEKPWIKASYAAVALSDMYFGGDSSLSKDEFDAKTIRQVLKISPGTGDLSSTIAFKDVFAQLIDMLTLTSVDGPRASIVGGTSDELFFGKEIDFPKYSSITGEYFPSQGLGKTDGSWAEPREIAPLIVLPDVIFFGGAALTISFTEAYAVGDSDDHPFPLEAYAGYVGLVGERELVGVVGSGTGGEEAGQIFSDASLAGYPGGFSSMGGTTAGGDPRFTSSDGDYGPGGTVRPTEPVRYLEDGSVDDRERDKLFGSYVPITDPNRGKTVKDAYDEIFLPYNLNDWRAKLFGVYRGAGAAAGGDRHVFVRPPDDTFGVYQWRIGMESYTLEERLRIVPGMTYSGETIPGETIRFGFYEGELDAGGTPPHFWSNAGRLAHEILARSTVDVEIRTTSGIVSTGSDSGYEGRRYGSNNAVSGRRSRRNLTHLLYLIERYYLPEAERRVREEDQGRYSEIVRGRQNFEGFGIRDRYLIGSTTAARTTIAVRFHEIIVETLELIIDALEDEIENPSETAGGRNSNTYGISKVVHDPADGSMELYTGSGDVDKLVFDATTDTFDTETGLS